MVAFPAEDIVDVVAVAFKLVLSEVPDGFVAVCVGSIGRSGTLIVLVGPVECEPPDEVVVASVEAAEIANQVFHQKNAFNVQMSNQRNILSRRICKRLPFTTHVSSRNGIA